MHNLLPIREAYEWKPTYRVLDKYSPANLLPIREAYEWKPPVIDTTLLQQTCFQFVKRMNGNRMPGINPISSVKKNPRFQRDYASVGTTISEEL